MASGARCTRARCRRKAPMTDTGPPECSLHPRRSAQVVLGRRGKTTRHLPTRRNYGTSRGGRIFTCALESMLEDAGWNRSGTNNGVTRRIPASSTRFNTKRATPSVCSQRCVNFPGVFRNQSNLSPRCSARERFESHARPREEVSGERVAAGSRQPRHPGSTRKQPGDLGYRDANTSP